MPAPTPADEELAKLPWLSPSSGEALLAGANFESDNKAQLAYACLR